MSATPSDSLRLRVEVPARARLREPVPVILRVENEGERPIDLYLTGRPIAFDLIVTDAEGRVVWQRLRDQVVAAILRIHTLSPGEALELEDAWDQRSDRGDPVLPGDYAVRGELLTESEPLITPTVPLRIVHD